MAQTQSVSATITDAGGVAWANGSYTFTSAAFPTVAIISGTLSGAGSFTSISFPTNAATAGVGGQWSARVCPVFPAPCFTTVVVVPGGPALNLSSVLIPAAISISASSPLPITAYADAEITGAIQGNSYFNATDNTLHVCKALPCASNWQSIVSSAGGAVLNGTNVYTSGLQDFSAPGVTMEIPEAAGFTTNVNSTIGLDTTANIVHFWTNNADSLNAVTTATSTTTTQPLFATAAAGIYNPRAIASADINTALTTPGSIGNTTPSSSINNVTYADGVVNTTINAALTAAPTGGTVIVPAGCSGAVATPAATVLISKAVHLILQCAITSSQVPNISIQSSGVIISGGGGNSPSGGATDAVIWTNSGTGNTIIYGDGVTSFRGIILEALNFRDSGAHLAARSILFKANAADISIRDVDTVGIGFDGSVGNQELVRFERVRVNNYVGSAYEFNCTAFCNSISFNSTYADLGTGAPGAGYDLGNGNFILEATDSDFAPVCGYRFTGGGSVIAKGTDDEQGAAASAGWCVTGGGINSTVTLVSPKAVAEVLAISITGGSNVTIINPNVTSSGGGAGGASTNSIVLGAGAVGQNFLFGTAALDKPISVNAAATLQSFGSLPVTPFNTSFTTHSLACNNTSTSIPCMQITADSLNHGPLLQLANSSGNSYNMGEIFASGTFDIRSTLGGGGFSFNPNGGAGRGIFTYTNTADRIYTFPNVAGNADLTSNTTTTTTQVLHGSATAGLGTWSAIATADIATALTTPGPIGGTTPGTGKFTSETATNLLWSTTAPTIAAGGCGGAAASIPSNNGTAAFTINTGTTPTAGGCTITMPAATTGWICDANHVPAITTTNFVIQQTGAASTTSVTLQDFSDVAAASAPAASVVWRVKCSAY
jgi:hypothetical protein